MSNTNPDIDTLFEEEFRNHTPTTDADGKRKWLYVRVVQGLFYRYRSYFSGLLLVLLFLWPHIKIQGKQAFLFNLIERRFIFFGFEFYPQDFHLVALGLLSGIVFIALFTALFGRVWCGWACPQTIFMEMLFRKIEHLIEGDHRAQERLDNAPLNAEKLIKKTAKHTLFLFFSFLIANTFLAYIIGADALYKIILDNPANHIPGLAAILIFSLVFYYVFAKFRENVCTVVCPYGRLQSALIDQHSLIVGYDFNRGEPRGRIKKKQAKKSTCKGGCEKCLALAAMANKKVEASKGDCIDCKICVQVCPTGIDIRDGLQMECVACTACIDACDEVMTKINKPTGLIRYTSLDNLEGKKTKRLNAKSIAYSAILFVLVCTFSALVYFRGDIEAIVLRTPGLTYQKLDGHKLEHLYNYTILNKTDKEFDLKVKVVGLEGAEIKWVGHRPQLVPNKQITGSFMIQVPENVPKELSTDLQIEFLDNTKVLDQVKSTFMSPNE